jgi:hypothetical protein
MTTREASALSMGDRQGQDGMVRVRRDQGTLFLVPSDRWRGLSAHVAFERRDLGSRSTVGAPDCAAHGMCGCRTTAIRNLNLPRRFFAS